MTTNTRVSPSTYAGLFIVCCSLLVFELLLTRLFSVALYYHFAFFAISIALFGLGAAGVCVQLFPARFSPDKASGQLTASCIGLSATMLLPALHLLKVDFPIRLLSDVSADTAIVLSIIFGLSSLPFFFGGLVTTLLFKHYAASISRLYFADLIGAAAGCILAFVLIEALGAANAVFAAAVLAASGALFFRHVGEESRADRGLRVAAAVVLALMLALLATGIKTSAFDLTYAKGNDRRKDEFSKWNSISRIGVFDCALRAPPERLAREVWGVSANYRGTFPALKCIDIDAFAGTFLTPFNGDFDQVAYVTQDPPSIVHRLRKGARTLVIGAGGGKDVLAALALGAGHVTAVELNPITVHDVMLDRYKAFTGGLYEHPRVTAVAAEGRSYVSSRDDTFDVVQLAFVDTSAATAGGAYALAENNLYTVDAFVTYLSKLNDGGVFSVSWVDVPGIAGGTRLVSVAIAALARLGIPDPRRHVVVYSHAPTGEWKVRSVLVKRTAFSIEEQQQIASSVRELAFEPTYLPDLTTSQEQREPFFAMLLAHPDRDALYRSLPRDISPVTDDRPFFFYQDRLRHFIGALAQTQVGEPYGAGIMVLSRTLLVTLLLAIAFLVAPMILARRWSRHAVPRRPLAASAPYLVYFTCVGVAFMFIEIALIQKLMLFLGHPFYTLLVSLMSILLFSGFGSLITARFSDRLASHVTRAIALLVLLCGLYMWGLPPLLTHLMGQPQPVKVLIAGLLLAPMGLLLGMPLPLGIKAVHAVMPEVIPWVWGLNGAASVVGSVVAIILATNVGYNAVLVTALCVYGLAMLIARRTFRL